MTIINVDLESLEVCDKCGIIFSISYVKIIPKKYDHDDLKAVCPLCKNETRVGN